MKFSFGALILIGIIAGSCSGSSKNEKEEFSLNNIEDIKTRQYAIAGRVLYQQLCANCHKDNGEGLGKLIPPLKNSDYMMQDISKTVQILKNGISGKIMVNGIEYNQQMPANPQLTNLEIAEITTYIYNVFGQKEILIDANKVNQYLNQ
ncbi:cytochrome c [Echinicola jeungdonensis]|nr:cytochrome c [Echinicola jeungdonensis]MDN3669980.1 cytochrome c [Echinicola jeungdonensis]